MNRYRMTALVLAVVMLLSACGGGEAAAQTVAAVGPADETQAAAPAPVQPPVETTAAHLCGSPCDLCGLCTNGACPEPACAEKCGGHEPPFAFTGGDYITREKVQVSAGKLVFDIDKDIYVPGNLEALGQLLTEALEAVSGLSLDYQGHSKGGFKDEKVHIQVSRKNLYAGQEWYDGLESSELGSAQAGPTTHVQVSPGDLLLGEYAIAHEMGHMVMYRQSEWMPCSVLSEGFAEYTAYLALQKMEEEHPDEAVYFGRSKFCIWNMSISDYGQLYAQPLEHWFQNYFEYSGNGNYAVGFRFMAYLRDVYGDYSKWIGELERQHPSKKNRDGQEPSVKWQIKALKDCYGEDVLDGFYPWLRENQAQFDLNWDVWESTIANWEKVRGINLYPKFNSSEVMVALGDISYQDLTVNLASVRQYLEEYKGIDTSGLMLQCEDPIEVRLYREDGSVDAMVLKEPVSLEGVTHVQLVGQGNLLRLLITGFPGEVRGW